MVVELDQQLVVKLVRFLRHTVAGTRNLDEAGAADKLCSATDQPWQSQIVELADGEQDRDRKFRIIDRRRVAHLLIRIAEARLIVRRAGADTGIHPRQCPVPEIAGRISLLEIGRDRVLADIEALTELVEHFRRPFAQHRRLQAERRVGHHQTDHPFRMRLGDLGNRSAAGGMAVQDRLVDLEIIHQRQQVAVANRGILDPVALAATARIVGQAFIAVAQRHDLTPPAHMRAAAAMDEDRPVALAFDFVIQSLAIDLGDGHTPTLSFQIATAPCQRAIGAR